MSIAEFLERVRSLGLVPLTQATWRSRADAQRIFSVPDPATLDEDERAERIRILTEQVRDWT